MNSSLRVRPPREGEAAQLAHLHVTSWKQAYSGLLPQRFWDDQALARRVQMWTKVIAAEEHDDELRGICEIRMVRPALTAKQES